MSNGIAIDSKRIRRDFPVLERMVQGKPLIYLDNAATSQKPRSVIDAITDYYERYNSNIHRGVHTLSMEATARYEEARSDIAQFINAPAPECLIFVRNTTEAINLVANTWAIDNINPGDEILLTEMEHHSNLVPWQKVAQTRGAELRFIPITDKHVLDLSQLHQLINTRTKLVAMTHMSNVLGTINPVKEIARVAHSVGAVVLIDGAQSIPHLPTDMQDMDCDMFAFSGHKMLGPTGIGVLYIKPEIMEQMNVFLLGGEMVKEVWYDHASWNDLPMRFEAGTPNIADTIALGAAVKYLSALGMENVRQHEQQLTRYALDTLNEINEIKIYGPTDLSVRGGIVSFHSSEVHPHDIGTALDNIGIAIRTGHHCAMPLMRKLGVPATARASFYIYNSTEEIDLLADGLRQTFRYFSHGIR